MLRIVVGWNLDRLIHRRVNFIPCDETLEVIPCHKIIWLEIKEYHLFHLH